MGIGQVEKCLPRPVPVHTLPATHVGYPHPCCSLRGAMLRGAAKGCDVDGSMIVLYVVRLKLGEHTE
jgi:hypothetical protein